MSSNIPVQTKDERMTQNIVIIGDTHFGVRNNSMIWLKHQTDGFMEIIRYVEESVKKYDETVIIHVGDLFDSRSSVNPMVYKSVENVMGCINRVMGESTNKAHMYIIGGNHDYYYQWESENNYSSTLMLPKFSKITYVNTQPEEYAGIIMIPWFVFHNPDMLSDIMRGRNPKENMIFTHTDPFHMNPELGKIIKGYPLVTGHIHQPVMDWDNLLLVTGATYPIDFADTNSERGFWTMKREYDGSHIGNITIDFHPVKSSIHFFTITEHMLGDWKALGIKKDDYVEVQIRAGHVDDYKDVLKELNDNFNINMMYLTESTGITMGHAEILNVDSVCRKLLPEKLKPIYDRMVMECK